MSKVLISIAGKLRVPTALLALVCCAAAANGPFIKQDDTIEPAVVEEDVLGSPVTDTNHTISTKPAIKVETVKPRTEADVLNRPVTDTNHIISTKPTIKLPSPPSVAKPTKTAQ
ncbi:hypothetical protein J4G57_20765 [Aeromonas caviae]|jgi:hypothetical protein|uniref:hypothetical protein n=1 Tax=Aeromonas caviae TaxID=648 RepID=UPI001BD56E87|nr:hypothetical protein [Aeromonas caviae]MBS4710282.1 hypothetical protein [Aeromonas caviae]MDX7716409.1 hypothetical protein [Aeromonas caviae]MDX7860728.1 hypothetical protein [Aeromonas caviae]MDX7874290.1 hypothetical protein [Aeromonas caviae]